MHDLDPTFRLTFIASGTDFSSHGRSKEWGFNFRLASGARVTIDVVPCPTWDVNDAQIPMCYVLKERPAPDASLHDMIIRKEPVLPVPFRDTPEVAQAFEIQGVDLGAGPSDMMVQGVMSQTGQAVWLIHYCDHMPFTTPFAHDEGE
jgi:hypothetical protein